MRGVILPGDSTTVIRELPDPEPGPGQVLLAMRASLTTLLETCEGDGPAADCPIITALGDEGHNGTHGAKS